MRHTVPRYFFNLSFRNWKKSEAGVAAAYLQMYKMKTKNIVLVATAVSAVVLLTASRIIVPGDTKVFPSYEAQNPAIIYVSDEPLGQTWITTEEYDGQTWYVLKATNTSGTCFCLSGNIRVISTGEVVPVVKNIPASANTKKNACRVYTLPIAFEKIEETFVAKDCIW